MYVSPDDKTLSRLDDNSTTKKASNMGFSGFVSGFGLVTSADEIGEVLFSVAFVCLSVCPEDISRTVIASNMRFSGLHITVHGSMSEQFW